MWTYSVMMRQWKYIFKYLNNVENKRFRILGKISLAKVYAFVILISYRFEYELYLTWIFYSSNWIIDIKKEMFLIFFWNDERNMSIDIILTFQPSYEGYGQLHHKTVLSSSRKHFRTRSPGERRETSLIFSFDSYLWFILCILKTN